MVMPKKDGEASLGIVVNGEYSLSRRASATARLKVLVLFPTPPFRFAIAITVAMVVLVTSMVHGGPSAVKRTYPLVCVAAVNSALPLAWVGKTGGLE
jgi:hypothetical protein